MGIGQAILGITYAMVMVPSLPEMIEGGKKSFLLQENMIDRMCPGIFSSCLGLGQVISPVFGAYFESYVGFENTTTIAGGLNLLFAVSMFVFTDGYAAFV